MKYPTGGSMQEFEKVAPGTHLAVCNMIVDVGLQPGNPKFAGMVDKKTGKPDSRGLPCPTVFFRFEVPGSRTAEGQPLVIYVNYRASMNEKATLRKMVESWTGKAMTDVEAEQFDIDALAGRACMISVQHTEDGKYANVKNIMALPNGIPAPKAENPLIVYSTEKDADYESLPKFLRDKIDGQIHAGDNADATRAKNPTNGAPGAGKTTPTPGGNAEDRYADAEADRQARKAGGQFVDDDVKDIPL